MHTWNSFKFIWCATKRCGICTKHALLKTG